MAVLSFTACVLDIQSAASRQVPRVRHLLPGAEGLLAALRRRIRQVPHHGVHAAVVRCIDKG